MRREAPHNLEAEEALLGAMLLSKEAIVAAAEVVQAEHFYKPAHSRVFDAIIGLWSAGEPVNVVTVVDELKRSGQLDAVGGPAGVVDLQASAIAISAAEKYARIVEEHALMRRLIAVGAEIVELGFSCPEDVGKALDQAESSIFAIATHRQADEGPVDGRRATEELLDELERLYEAGQAIAGLRTGYHDLDKLLLGLQERFYLLGARPAMGKTALALGITAHVVLREKRPVLFASMEMSRLELMQRLFAAEARVDSERLRTGRLDDADWNKINSLISRHTDDLELLEVDDTALLGIMQLRSRARKVKSKHKDLGLVVVDYIGLMETFGKAENRQVQIADLSRGLKLLSRELRCPVLALAQLNRGLESRADKRPMLSDLRESGALEQDADVVMFLYRDHVYHPETGTEGLAEVIVAKNRQGPTGTVDLAFMGEFTRFENLSYRD